MKEYFKPNIQVEPIIQGWYAWIHLVSPATFSLNIKNRYLPILRSYVEDRDLHVEAVANSAMRGGPFVDLPDDRTADAQVLLNNTEAECAAQLDFANALEQLSRFLKQEAKGYSMEPLYARIPAPLRGLVELYYDLNGSPAFRMFEGLLYKTDLYRSDFHKLAFSMINRDHNRPFILSTPRFTDDQTTQVSISFHSTVIDKLFNSKRHPVDPREIMEMMKLSPQEAASFRSYFHDKAPKPYNEYTGSGMRIRYFGHACILVEARGVNILIDPVLSYTYDSEVSRLTYEDLPERIDYVLITHSHQDHILVETMLQIRHKVQCVVIGRNLDGFLVDPSLRLALLALGFKNIKELCEMEEIEIPGGSIVGIPFMGEHHDLPIHSKLCFLVKIEHFSFLAMADSCNVDSNLYDRVKQLTSSVDVLFLGMECDGSPPSWAYGPLLPFRLSRELDYSRRGRGCNFQEAKHLVECFGCSEVYVYAMGLEPWLKYILNVEFTDLSNPIVQSRMLIDYCKERGIASEMLFGEREILLKTGREVSYSIDK
jgi:L-ascorbate metabolism protein UlaG (beta-lactamase superfamily)